MKNLSLITLLAFLMVLPACNTTPKKVAYQSLASVGVLVDNGMKAAATAKKAGKLTDTQWKSIADKHAKFRTAYNTACDMAALDLTNLATNDLIELANQLITLINQFGVTT